MPQKLGRKTIYLHEKNLRTRHCRGKFIKSFFPENAKKTCKPNNRDLSHD